MIEIKKKCTKHGEVKGDNVYIKKYRKKGELKKTVYCKLCIKDKNKKYYDRKYQDNEFVKNKRNKDKKRWIDKKDEITKKRKQPERLAKRRDAYYKYVDKYRTKCSKKQKEYREELHDSYIKKVIQNGDKTIKFEDIPPPMVELKRAIMLLKKGIKSKQIEIKAEEIKKNEIR